MLAEVLHMIAAEGTTSGSPAIDLILPFVNLGVIVVLVIMVVTKNGFVPKWSLDDAERRNEEQVRQLNESHAREMAAKEDQIDALQADKKELKDTNEELQNLARDRLLPALIESSRLAAAYVAELQRRGSGGARGSRQ